jgi:hypothetical protein
VDVEVDTQRSRDIMIVQITQWIQTARRKNASGSGGTVYRPAPK